MGQESSYLDWIDLADNLVILYGFIRERGTEVFCGLNREPMSSLRLTRCCQRNLPWESALCKHGSSSLSRCRRSCSLAQGYDRSKNNKLSLSRTTECNQRPSIQCLAIPQAHLKMAPSWPPFTSVLWLGCFDSKFKDSVFKPQCPGSTCRPIPYLCIN